MVTGGETKTNMSDAKPPPLVHLFAPPDIDGVERNVVSSSLQDSPATQCVVPHATSSSATTDFVLSDPARRATRDDFWALLVSEHISRQFTFQQTSITVGRGAGCDVTLRDLRVSVRHFTIYLEREVHVTHAALASGGTTPQERETRAPHRDGGRGRKKDGGHSKVDRAVSRRRGGRHKNGQPVTSHLSSPSLSPPPPSSPSMRQGAVDEAEVTTREGDAAGGVKEHGSSTETWTTLRVVLEDHSTNGTYVNDVRVGKGRRCELKSGDDIAIVPLPEKRTRDESDEAGDDFGDDEAMADIRHGETGGRVEDRLRRTRPLTAWIDTAPEGRTYLEHFCLHLYPKEPPTSPAGLTGPALAPSLPHPASGSLVRHRDTTVPRETEMPDGLRRSPAPPSFTGPPSRLLPPAFTPAVPRQPPLPTSPLPERGDDEVACAVMPRASSSPLRVSVSSQLTGSQAGRQLVANICAGFIAPQRAAATPRASPSMSSVTHAAPHLAPHAMLSPVSYTVMPRRQLQWGPCVGSGTSGRVYLGIDIASSKLIAIKVLRHTCPSSRGSSGGRPEDARTRGVINRAHARTDSTNRPERNIGDDEDEDEESTILSLSDVSLDHTRPAHETDELLMADSDPEHNDVHTTAVHRSRRVADEQAAQIALIDQRESDEQDGVVNVSVNLRRAYLRELWFLTQLQNHRIVRCLGFQQEEDKGLCILMEYVAGGTLQSLIKSFGAFEENVIRLYTVQILEGLEYLHGCSVVHGDLKSANVLVSERGNVKLTDFGTSRMLRDLGVDGARCPHCHGLITTGGGTPRGGAPSAPTPSLSSSSPLGLGRVDAQPVSYCHCARESLGDAAAKTPGVLCGTPLYMSPELIRTQLSTFASDVWALGCIVFEMATGGVLPWRAVHHMDVCSILFHIGNQTNRGPSFADVYAARAALATSEPRRPTSAPTLDEEGGEDVAGGVQMRSYAKTGVTAAGRGVLPQPASAPGTPASLSPSSSGVSDAGSAVRTPSAALIDFLHCMLNVDAAQRPRVSDLLMHPFILDESDAEAMERWYARVGLQPPLRRTRSASRDAAGSESDVHVAPSSSFQHDAMPVNHAPAPTAAPAAGEALWHLPTPTVVPSSSTFADGGQGVEGGGRSEGESSGIAVGGQCGQGGAVSQESQPLILIPRNSPSSPASFTPVAPPSSQERRSVEADVSRQQARSVALLSHPRLTPLSLPTCGHNHGLISAMRQHEGDVATSVSQPSRQGQDGATHNRTSNYGCSFSQGAGVSHRSSVLRSHQRYLRAQERQRRRQQQQQQQQYCSMKSDAAKTLTRQSGCPYRWPTTPYSPLHRPVTQPTSVDSVLHENARPPQYILPSYANGAALATTGGGVLGDLPPPLSAPASLQTAPLCRGAALTPQTSQHPLYIAPTMGTMTLMMNHVTLGESGCRASNPAVLCDSQSGPLYDVKRSTLAPPSRYIPQEAGYFVRPTSSQSHTPPSVECFWPTDTILHGPPNPALYVASYHATSGVRPPVAEPTLSSTASASSAVLVSSTTTPALRRCALMQRQTHVAGGFTPTVGGRQRQQTAPHGAKMATTAVGEDGGGMVRQARRLESDQSVPAVVVGGRCVRSMELLPVFPAIPPRCPSPTVAAPRDAKCTASMSGREKVGVLGAAEDRRSLLRAAPAVAPGEGEERSGSDGQLDKSLGEGARGGVRRCKPRATSWRVRGRCAGRRTAKQKSRKESRAKR